MKNQVLSVEQMQTLKVKAFNYTVQTLCKGGCLNANPDYGKCCKGFKINEKAFIDGAIWCIENGYVKCESTNK